MAVAYEEFPRNSGEWRQVAALSGENEKCRLRMGDGRWMGLADAITLSASEKSKVFQIKSSCFDHFSQK